MKRILFVLLGSISLAIGIDAFIVPYHLLDGGMIGIGLIFKYLWGFKTGFTILILSIPIYLLAWFYFRPIFYNSLHGLIISSLLIDFLAPLNHFLHIPQLWSAFVGGVFVGLGIGLMLKVQVSTGGLDLLAQFIAQKASINVGLIILFLDTIILILGYKIIGINLVLSAITVASVGVMTTIINLEPRKYDPY